MPPLNADDLQDLRFAHHFKDDEEGESKPFWKYLGVGVITGAAGDDPAGIGTYSIAGAQFGTALLWLTPLCVPLMIAVQEMCGRIGRVCGCGLACVIKAHYPRWLLFGVLLLLGVANIFNIYADLNVMASSAQMLFGGNIAFWLTAITAAIIVAQITIPYHYYVNVLKWLALSLAAYVVTDFLPSVHNDWKEIAFATFIPTWKWNARYLMVVVGYLGTTISPYLFFWQAGEEVEEEIAEGKADAPGHRIISVSKKEIRNMRIDTSIGMFASQVITFFILICTAATLHKQGITEINTAQDAAKALLPLGKSAYWLFTLGILGTGLLAIPTLAGSAAYALAETFGWRYGLYRRFSRARAFYLTIAAIVILGYAFNFLHIFSPIKALYYSSILSGIVTFPLLIVLLLICNNKNIVKDYVNGRLANIFGTLTAVLMGGCIFFMFWSAFTGMGS